MEFCFLISSERSGSNLITRLMDGHSRVCGPSPTHLFRILVEHRSRYGNLAERENWRLLLSDTVALFNTKLGIWHSSVSKHELEQNVDRGSLACLLRYIYEKEAAVSDKSFLFVKENHSYRYFPFLDRFFPESNFVFLVRDPRDMALSWKLSADLRGCVIRAAETWKTDQVASLALYDDLAVSERIVCLRYEDLLTKTHESLEKVCNLLGLKSEETMANLNRRPANWANAAVSQAWANLRKPVMRNNFNKYRTALSTEEIQFVEGVCETAMLQLGYALDYPDRPPLASLRSAIQPLEQYEKPHYASQPDELKKRQEKRVSVLKKIRNR